MVDGDEDDKVVEEYMMSQPLGRRDAAVAQVVAAIKRSKDIRPQKRHQQGSHRVDTCGPHEEIHSDAHGQPGEQDGDGRRIDGQKDDERDVDKRIEVDADREVVEEEDLQQHGDQKERRISDYAIHGGIWLLMAETLVVLLPGLQVEDLAGVAVLDEDDVGEPGEIGGELQTDGIGGPVLVHGSALDPPDEDVLGEELRKPGRDDPLPDFGLGILGQLAEQDGMGVDAVPIHGPEIIGTLQLAAGSERGVKQGDGDRIAVGTIDDISQHGAAGSEQRHIGSDAVAQTPVDGDEILRPVDGIGDDGSGHDAELGPAQIEHVTLEPVDIGGLVVLGKPFLKEGDTVEEDAVLGFEPEVAPHPGGKLVDRPGGGVGTREQAGLREVGGPCVIPDGEGLQHDEQHHEVDTTDELDELVHDFY